MNKNLLLPFVFLFSLLLTSCSVDFRQFYFKLEDFIEPKIYVFEVENQPEITEYWKMSTINENELVTETYDAKLDLAEYFREGFDGQGSKLLEFSRFQDLEVSGQTRKIPTKIIKDDVFKWNSPNQYEYEVRYKDDWGMTTFNKKRAFMEQCEVEVMGETFDGVSFKGKYNFTSPESNMEYTFMQIAYYCEKYGFVKYERHLEDGSVIYRELTKVLSETEFEELQNLSQ